MASISLVTKILTSRRDQQLAFLACFLLLLWPLMYYLSSGNDKMKKETEGIRVAKQNFQFLTVPTEIETVRLIVKSGSYLSEGDIIARSLSQESPMKYIQATDAGTFYADNDKKSVFTTGENIGFVDKAQPSGVYFFWVPANIDISPSLGKKVKIQTAARTLYGELTTVINTFHNDQNRKIAIKFSDTSVPVSFTPDSDIKLLLN
jgi:hypothetical protein